MVDNKLAKSAGYEDVPDYFSKHLVDGAPSSLGTYGAVARSFSEEIAVRFGVTRLNLLLTYKEVADIEVDHDAPGPTLIEVQGEDGAFADQPRADVVGRFAKGIRSRSRCATTRASRCATSRPSRLGRERLPASCESSQAFLPSEHLA